MGHSQFFKESQGNKRSINLRSPELSALPANLQIPPNLVINAGLVAQGGAVAGGHAELLAHLFGLPPVVNLPNQDDLDHPAPANQL